jgi:RND family efflux transporter MFP subunit
VYSGKRSMNKVETSFRQGKPSVEQRSESPPKRPGARRRWGGRLLALGAFLLLGGGLAFGATRYYTQYREVIATTEQRRNFVPTVRVATVRPSNRVTLVTLPATTLAFSAANLYARASGYIDKRLVDIGDRVKEGQLLVAISAPELDHQISQNEATLVQLKEALLQAQANLDLAKVTWDRDRPLVGQGWVTQQQGSIDTQTLKAREAAVRLAEANVKAQEALLKVLNQQKAYQSVIAPFDGVITARNIDVGSLVQADAASGTFMFTIMQSDVIRTQVYVPQDQAFDVAPGVDAVVRVPELPGRTFPGKVTRIADALDPGTRTLLTEIDIPNPDGALKPGTYCRVELHVPHDTPSFLVPAEAIIFNRDGLQVGVVEGGEAHIRKVSVARDLGTQVEVRDGVKEGDVVVLNPQVDLVEGSKVKAKPQTAEAMR